VKVAPGVGDHLAYDGCLVLLPHTSVYNRCVTLVKARVEGKI
jgi:hypothetical protein